VNPGVRKGGRFLSFVGFYGHRGAHGTQLYVTIKIRPYHILFFFNSKIALCPNPFRVTLKGFIKEGLPPLYKGKAHNSLSYKAK